MFLVYIIVTSRSFIYNKRNFKCKFTKYETYFDIDDKIIINICSVSNTYNALVCLKLLVECNGEDEEDSWVDITDMPHLVLQCQQLKKQGFVLQNEQNKFLFKLNI